MSTAGGCNTGGELRAFSKRHEFFVGVDSDGCVFDTMNVKQRIHFHPLIIRYWGLEKCEQPFRACAEFVNLGSKTRGSNRFPALLRTFELLCRFPGISDFGVALPKLDAFRAYVQSGLPLGNPSLEREVAGAGDPELKRLLEWSLAINDDIHRNMKPVPPFAWALKALELIRRHCDVVVVSQTPEQALVNEWELHRIRGFVDCIAGQELGSKAEQIRMATAGQYAPSRILMIGDAPGDQVAAKENGALFYPILPGREDAAWERFVTEAFPKFLDGTFAGPYENARINEFDKSLPATPPWDR